LHGGLGHDARIDAKRTKRADLKQDGLCLCIIKTGTMAASQKAARKMSVTLFVLMGGNFL
jgi:hypothetical protein